MKAECVLKRIESYSECQNFVEEFYRNPELASFRFANLKQIEHNLSGAIEKGSAYGVFREERIIGVFGFLVLPEDSYIEMTVGLSCCREAYERVIAFLEENYPCYNADFVFNPRNCLLKEILSQKAAKFETEQQRMEFQGPVPDMDTPEIIPFSPEYTSQYLDIHDTDLYWTGERVLKAPEKFRTFLAVEDSKVVGYIDVTHCFDENEPYSFTVLETYRRRGYGRKLLAKTLKENAPKAMMLMVDVDNFRSIPLYESMGFVKAENQNCLTVHWKIGEHTVNS